MRRCYKLLVFLLIPDLSNAYTVNVRVMTCPPPIAEALRKNLAAGTLTAESFDHAYQRLISSREIAELDRFTKPEVIADTLVEFASPVVPGQEAGDRWRMEITMDFPGGDSRRLYCRSSIEAMAPMRTPSEPRFFRSNSAFTLPLNTWNIVAETSLGEQRMIFLYQVTSPLQQPDDSNNPSVIVEGYVLATSASEAAAMAGKSPLQLSQVVNALQASKKSNYFRFLGTPGGRAMFGKGDSRQPWYQSPKFSETDALGIDIETLLSPDQKLVDCAGDVSLSRSLRKSDKPLIFRIALADTFPVGSWKALAAKSRVSARQLEYHMVRHRKHVRCHGRC